MVFFHAKEEYLNKILTKGDKKVVSGVIEQYTKGKQIIHPDHIVKLENRSDIEAIEPIYPLTQGLTQKVLSKAIKNALALTKELPEWLDTAYVKKQKWPEWSKPTLNNIRMPPKLF